MRDKDKKISATMSKDLEVTEKDIDKLIVGSANNAWQPVLVSSSWTSDPSIRKASDNMGFNAEVRDRIEKILAALECVVKKQEQLENLNFELSQEHMEQVERLKKQIDLISKNYACEKPNKMRGQKDLKRFLGRKVAR